MSLDRALRDAIAKRERKEDDERDVFFVREEEASASTHTPEEALTKRRWSLFLPRLDIHIYTRTNAFGGGQNKAAKVVEAATKISFDERTSDGLKVLLGVGARVSKVAFLNVKVRRRDVRGREETALRFTRG